MRIIEQPKQKLKYVNFEHSYEFMIHKLSVRRMSYKKLLSLIFENNSTNVFQIQICINSVGNEMV